MNLSKTGKNLSGSGNRMENRMENRKPDGKPDEVIRARSHAMRAALLEKRRMHPILDVAVACRPVPGALSVCSLRMVLDKVAGLRSSGRSSLCSTTAFA